MRGRIYVYSGTGNTRLACESIVARVSSVEFQITDILQDDASEGMNADFAGFATWADFWNPPQRMRAFMKALPRADETPAFVLTTFGSSPGRTLVTLHQSACAKGFRIVAAHGLHMPENYPPLIKRGATFLDAPDEKKLASFLAFIETLDAIGQAMEAGTDVPTVRPGPARFLPPPPRTMSRRLMGTLHVDETLCTECGICRNRCPYDAIQLDPKPLFDAHRCYGCWACYNHCPTNAVYTKKVRGVPQYSRPSDALHAKLRG